MPPRAGRWCGHNPRLHTSGREKVWVACDQHKKPFADFLAARSFLTRIEPLATTW